MARYIELAIALALGALAWPTLHGLILPANAQSETQCGQDQNPCFVALVTCVAANANDCSYADSGDNWRLVSPGR